MDFSNLPRNNCYCIDAKSFYASVECVLRGLDPLTTYLAVVGSLDRSGAVVLAASPLMKRDFKIKTGTRHYEIPKHPHIHVVEARMGLYLDFSMKIPKILQRFTPLEAITIYSVDECFFTVDGAENLFGDKFSIARQVQAAIKKEIGVPTAVGCGENYYQSKVALDCLAKRNEATGYIEGVTYETFADKMWPTPIKDIWGIGSRIEKRLHRLGIYTLGDVAKYPLNLLKKQFGNAIGQELYNHSWGIDLTNPYYKPQINQTTNLHQKGFSAGITLLRDYQGAEIYPAILDQVEEVTRRARASKMAGRTITLAVGFSHTLGGGGFSQAKTVHNPTNITMDIYEVCREIFNKHYEGQVVRNLHVSLTNLTQDEIVQLDLFEDKTKQREIGYVMDSIKNKFGSTAIFRATSLMEGGTALARAGTIGGHKA
ncbi:Y-family DNA polymerase [Paenibacillus gansuensis]|uniref:Nucleotidyltransferase n=1 Tax=Paenibacillus gansuensis TaxID=306542 RepID=A0ABW5PGP5_9BACL